MRGTQGALNIQMFLKNNKKIKKNLNNIKKSNQLNLRAAEARLLKPQVVMSPAEGPP